MGIHDSDIGMKLVQYVCLLFSLCVHEAAHALTANRCGDPTARLMGRATLNPLAHIDPIGTVVMPLLMMTTNIPLIGWAKPVPFNPRNLHNMRRDPALIALAGPMSNLLLAVTAAVMLRIVVMTTDLAPNPSLIYANPVSMVLFSLVVINLLLMLFNLIPVPPLDGGHIIYPILPPGGQRVIEQIGPFGILIAFFLANKVLGLPFALLLKSILVFVYWGQI